MRLKELRIKAGLSQQQLAFKLHTTQNTISRYENSQREMDYQTLIEAADLFNVSIDYLLGRTENPTFLREASYDPLTEFAIQTFAKAFHKPVKEILKEFESQNSEEENG